MSKRRIGILTGGGDVPGLNVAIKSVVYNAVDDGAEVIGIRRGWGGFLNYNLDDPATHAKYIVELNKINTRTIDRTGGTFLHTSRTNPYSVRPKDTPEFLRNSSYGQVVREDGSKNYTDYVTKVMEHLKLDSLITIGGDDTLSYSNRLSQSGVPLVAIPKTMDNDVFGTDYCIGFSTSITSSVQLITNFRTSVGSHERIGVVELFGRYSGETALITGYLAYADRTIICEVPYNPQHVCDLLIEDIHHNPSSYAIVVISEGATTDGGEIVQRGEADAYGHKKLGGIGEMLSDQIKTLTGQNTMFQRLAYLVRSGAADMLDRMVGMNFGTLAWHLTQRKEFGNMVAINHGNYNYVPISSVVEKKRNVDVDRYYDKENYQPKIQKIDGLPMFLH